AVEEVGGREDAGRDPSGLLLEAVAPQAPRDERVVEGPDGADVIADRVVAPFTFGERSHAPAREEAWAEEMVCDRLRLRLVDDAAPEQVADVRAEHVDLLSLAVESQSEVLAVRDPEIPVEAALEVGRLLLELGGELRVLPDLPGKPRSADLGVVRVPLELARRTREPRQAAIVVRDRIPRVLPALVLEPGLLVAALVPDVAVAHQVRVLVDPVQGRPSFVLEATDEPPIPGPALVLVEQHDKEGRCVSAAVVGRLRPFLESRQLAVPHLVEDAPRILVAEVVEPGALPVP